MKNTKDDTDHTDTRRSRSALIASGEVPVFADGTDTGRPQQTGLRRKAYGIHVRFVT